jgi:hypothetical protein
VPELVQPTQHDAAATIERSSKRRANQRSHGTSAMVAIVAPARSRWRATTAKVL